MKKYASIFDVLKTKPQIFIDRLYSGTAAFSTANTSTIVINLTQKTLKSESQEVNLEHAKWACQAIFQSLSPVSKAVVMKCLHFPDVIKSEELRRFITSTQVYEDILDELTSLRILREVVTDTEMEMEVEVVEDKLKNQVFELHPDFRMHLSQAIFHPSRPWEEYIQQHMLIDRSPPTIEFLETFSRETWYDVLGYLVNIVPASRFEYKVVPNFFANTKMQVKLDGSIASAASTSDRKLTEKGYEYMLKDYPQQVWDFFTHALSHSPNEAEALTLMFILSYTELGKGYPMEALTTAQKQMIFELSQVGIVYMHSIKSALFYPTKTAMNLIFGSQGLIAVQNANQSSIALNDANKSGEGSDSYQLQIIVETNMQVLAYVRSELHLALLEMFVEIHVRMPNMAFGRLTRNRVKDAYRAGIKAEQIIDFLRFHAHPVVKKDEEIKGISLIPENVTDQLILWRNELRRIHSAVPAVVLDCTDLNQPSFDKYVEDLKHKQALLGSAQNPKQLVVVVPDMEIEARRMKAGIKSTFY